MRQYKLPNVCWKCGCVYTHHKDMIHNPVGTGRPFTCSNCNDAEHIRLLLITNEECEDLESFISARNRKTKGIELFIYNKTKGDEI